jgi:hypothetical protein
MVSNTPTGGGFTAITAGGKTSMAIRSDGTLVSWGLSGNGQVSGMPTGSGFTAVATGGDYSVAISSDGTLVHWGGDPFLQGINTPTGGGFTAVAAGVDHSVAIRAQTAATATALTLSASTVTYGSEQAEQISVTVSSAGTPTGTVTVAAGATTLCTITLASGAGSCALRAAQLPAGGYQVTGSYSGDAGTSPSASPAQALTVSKASSATALNLSAAAAAYGSEQAERVSVTVSSAGTRTGKVTVKAGTATLCTITLASGAGSCALRAAQLPAGAYQVTGSYSGDADTSPSASPAQALTVFLSGPNYAGWSVHPPGSTVHSVQAEWKVPQVTCGTIFTRTWYLSRVAVWAGMWGPPSGVSTKDWLPQAGTVSQCNAGKITYTAFSELAAAHGGYKRKDLTIPVAAGDTIQASVTYLGPNSTGQLLFSYTVTNVTQHKKSPGKLPLPPSTVQPGDATSEGGVIIEDEPTQKDVCVSRDPLLGICLRKATVGGLSMFTTPVLVAEPFAQVNGKGIQSYPGNALYRWDMISDTGSALNLAATSPITAKGFSVTWKNYF